MNDFENSYLYEQKPWIQALSLLKMSYKIQIVDVNIEYVEKIC